MFILRRKLSMFLLICMGLLILGGCQPSESVSEIDLDASVPEISKQSESTGSQADMVISEQEGTLRVAYPLSNNVLFDYTIDMFAQKYPNVTVIKDTGYEDDISVYTQKMAVELMSGESPDVIDAAMLSPAKYAQSGLFEDLNLYIGNREDYFENILDAFELEGGLYQIPVWWDSNVVFTSKTLTDALGLDCSNQKIISYKDIYDILTQAREKGLIGEDYFIEKKTNQDHFYYTEICDYLDYSEKICRFDSPEFIEYLKITKSLPADLKLESVHTKVHQ